jgi:hypothetical protein
METYPSPHLGLDHVGFWHGMGGCFAGLLGSAETGNEVELDPALIPVLELDPPPTGWPDPEEYLREEHS